MDQKRLENAQEFIREKSISFSKEWGTRFQKKRTILMMNSMSLPLEGRIEAQDSMEYLQSFCYGRLLELVDPNVRIVYVTPKLSSPALKSLHKFLNLHFSLQELLASKRLVIIEVPKPSYIVRSVSLTSSVLIQTQIFKQIKSHIQNQNCYVESLVAGPEDARICHQLDLSLFGNVDQVTLMALNRQETRNFIANCNHSEMNGVVVGYNCKPFFFRSKVIQVLKEFPRFKRFLFKMNNQMNGKGLAYFDRTDYNFLVKDQMDSLHHVLRLIQSSSWSSTQDFLNKFMMYGGVIEAVPDSAWDVKYPVVAVRVFPDGTAKVIGSADNISGKPFEITGMICPQQSCVRMDVKNLALEFADELAEGGYFGMVTCEFIAWKDPSDGDYHIKTLAVKPYFTEAVNFIQLVQYGSRSWDLWTEDLVHIMAPEQIPQYNHLKKLLYYDQVISSNQSKLADITAKLRPKYRVGLILWGLEHESVPFLMNESFESLCSKSDMYLHEDGTGSIIPCYCIQEKSPIIVINLHKSMEKVIMQTLKDFVNLSRSLTLEIRHNFLDFAKLLVQFLESNDADYAPIPCPNPVTNVELELFVAKYLNDPILFEGSREPEKEVKEVVLSHETIKLLSLDIPSYSLRLDSSYGKIQVMKPMVLPNRIPQGTSPEDYIKILDKQNHTPPGATKTTRTRK
jgi:hypothetical protein